MSIQKISLKIAERKTSCFGHFILVLAPKRVFILSYIDLRRAKSMFRNEGVAVLENLVSFLGRSRFVFCVYHRCNALFHWPETRSVQVVILRGRCTNGPLLPYFNACYIDFFSSVKRNYARD